MNKACHIFNSNHNNFNCRKIVCLKFGGKTHAYEHVTLDSNDIEWVSEIKHLENLNISLDSQIKTLYFIGFMSTNLL